MFVFKCFPAIAFIFTIMKIVILTDSYGGPRVHKNVTTVFPEQTYIELVKNELEQKGNDVEGDYLSFRKITELPQLIKKYPDAELFILQAGVVDVYPRVISYKMTASQTFFAKAVRRIIRSNRNFFIRYVRSFPWSGTSELKTAIRNIVELSHGKLVWINVAPVNQLMEKDTPGANKTISKFNQVLSELTAGDGKSSTIDIHNLLSEEKDLEKYLHPVDSHLNIEGNIFYAKHILEHLKNKYRL
ncbi:hypothetical protein BH09BAC5_BH09BAC5_28730 [soil metagenome]